MNGFANSTFSTLFVTGSWCLRHYVNWSFFCCILLPFWLVSQRYCIMNDFKINALQHFKKNKQKQIWTFIYKQTFYFFQIQQKVSEKNSVIKIRVCYKSVICDDDNQFYRLRNQGQWQGPNVGSAKLLRFPLVVADLRIFVVSLMFCVSQNLFETAFFVS